MEVWRDCETEIKIKGIKAQTHTHTLLNMLKETIIHTSLRQGEDICACSILRRDARKYEKKQGGNRKEKTS